MKKVELGFARIEIHPKFAIIRANEGEDITLQKHLVVFEWIESNIVGQYGVIGDRINSYSLEPEVYKDINGRERLRAIAIVAHREVTVRMSEYEREMIIKKYSLFYNLRDAKVWIKGELGV